MHALLLLGALAVMPPFTLEGLGNADASSVSLLGRPAIVRFFASWCASCKGVDREVDDALRATGGGAAYLAVSLDETESAARRGILSEMRSPGETFYFDRGRRLADALGGVAVPTVIVLGRDGRIVARLSGHFGAAQRGELRAALATAAR